MEKTTLEQAKKLNEQIEYLESYLLTLKSEKETVEKNSKDPQAFQVQIYINTKYGKSTPLHFSDAATVLQGNIMLAERELKKIKKQFSNL